jgi:hypothetical protein
MVRILLSVCFFLFFYTTAIAGLNITIPNSSINTQQSSFAYDEQQQTIQNGTLSITMQNAPAGGLSIPRVLVLRDFSAMYHNSVNWGGNWSLTIPSGNYSIIPLPASDGTNFYVANSNFVSVPPGGLTTQLITYRLI